MSARPWLCEDAYIVAQRLRIVGKHSKRPSSSSKSPPPTSSVPACMRSLSGSRSRSATKTGHEGSTYVLYRPVESVSGEHVSIIYNNCMCWRAVKEKGTRTLVLRNLILDDTDSYLNSKYGLKSKSSSLHLDVQQPRCSIDDLRLTTQDCYSPTGPDKSIANLSTIDRIHVSATAAMHARQLIVSLGS